LAEALAFIREVSRLQPVAICKTLIYTLRNDLARELAVGFQAMPPPRLGENAVVGRGLVKVVPHDHR